MKHRSTNLTYEDIATAIEAILAENNKPTIRRIHQHLGRGSLTTISEFAREYFSSPRYSLQMSKSQLSDQFMGAAIAEVKRITDVKMKKTALQLETALEDLDDINLELSEALSEIDSHKGQIATLTEKSKRIVSESEINSAKSDTQIEAEKNRAIALENEVKEARQELLQAKSDLAVAEQKINAANDVKARLENEETLNAALQSEIRQLNQEIKELMKGSQKRSSSDQNKLNK